MPQSVLYDPAFRGDVEIPGEVDLQAGESSLWPRHLVLDEETEKRLAEFLVYEIDLCWSERNLLIEDWKQWQKDYWAKPAQTVKNFPFKKAANVVIPVTAIAVETIAASILTTIFATKPFYSLKAREKEWIDVVPAVEEWFQTQIEDYNAIDMDGFARESIMEFIKLGTGVGKTGFERDLRKVNVDLPDGTSSPRWVTRKSGSTLFYVPLANFLMRLHEKDPQTAVWCGEEHNDITWAQAKRHVLSGRWNGEALEKVKAWFGQKNSTASSSGQEYDQARRDNEGDEPAWTDTLDVKEIWCSFDVDGDGIDEEIVLDFHKESRAFLGAWYNWYDDLNRPYRIGTYIPVEGRWTGIGVGKQLEQFQALITTVHRQRLDAGTLANMGQLALKKTCGYTTDEPIWPGKIWLVDNPATDIYDFALSNHQHFSQIQNEDAARVWADKRSGANELILGSPQIGTPPPATSDMAKLAEGKKKFDMVLKNVRRWYGLLGTDLLACEKQFGDRGRSWLAQAPDGQYVERFLNMPQASIRRGLHVELSVTDSVTNKDADQQKWANLFSILSAHYDKALERAGQVAGVLQNPELFVMFAEIALGSSNTAMRRLLEAYQVPDIDSFLLDLEKLKGGEDVGPETSGGGTPGTAGNGQGVSGTSRVQGLFDALGATGVGTHPGGAVVVERFRGVGP